MAYTQLVQITARCAETGKAFWQVIQESDCQERDVTGVYSWWSYRFNARKNNAGWRIDYWLVSSSLREKLVDAKIHGEVLGSDHCPVELEIDL